MKRNNAVFLLLLCVAVTLTVLIMADNVTSNDARFADILMPSPDPAALRAELLRKGLILHDARYWKNAP